MKRKNVGILTAAAVLVLATGCQKKYEEIKLDQTSWEQEGTNNGVDDSAEVIEKLGQEEESNNKEVGRLTDAQENEDKITAETSTKESVIVAEPVPAIQDRDEMAFVSGDKVNLRTSPSTGSDVVAVLGRGETIHRTGYSDEWSQIEYNGMTCYIASRYVSAAPQQTNTLSTTTNGTISQSGEITLNPSWIYADFSKINSGAAKLYKAEESIRKGITICVNAGHGTSGGSSVKTLCHPDGTPKVTGGTTGQGATSAVAVSSGMTFSDGTAEAKVTLAMALKFKDKLLAAGYDVLMIRESDDVQLDNIARTVIANNAADCHIALHWDSTSNNKGAFYMSVPDVASYRGMEPVKSNWEKHHALGENLVAGLKGAGVKIFSSGSMAMDLTQTSYSTVPSVDIELGDKASDHSDATLDILATGLVAGVNGYFGQ